jgi:hypothetical protein
LIVVVRSPRNPHVAATGIVAAAPIQGVTDDDAQVKFKLIFYASREVAYLLKQES